MQEMEETLFIIKPDAISHAESIIKRVEDEGFEIVEKERLNLDRKRASEFYAIHKEKPFYSELVNFMSSGPVVVLILTREDAVSYLRKVVGATNPSDAAPGTLRKEFGSGVCTNAVHASDSKANADKEIAFFFK